MGITRPESRVILAPPPPKVGFSTVSAVVFKPMILGTASGSVERVQKVFGPEKSAPSTRSAPGFGAPRIWGGFFYARDKELVTTQESIHEDQHEEMLHGTCEQSERAG